jgi:RNA polymerase sigma factor (sigma-70 family)
VLLREYLQSLPSQQRRALKLDAEGESRRDIAQLLGCGEETVKTHLERARRRLRAELRNRSDLE